MVTKVTNRRFSYQVAQEARNLVDAAANAGGRISMGEALRRAEGDHAGADAFRHREAEQAAQ